MKKRVRDLTGDEVSAFCIKHKTCKKCPFDIPKTWGCFLNMLDEEIEVEVDEEEKDNDTEPS